MSNMSYCRFENTLDDLIDCRESLHEPASQLEHKKRKALIEVCAGILQDIALYDEDFSEIVEQADFLPVDDEE